MIKDYHIMGTILCIVGIAVTAIICFIEVKVEHGTGQYDCPNCNERYVPAMKTVIMAAHIGTSSKMKFPSDCKKGCHKKVLTK